MNFNINPNCTELIESGKCQADCCGPVPMPERYWQQLKKLVRNKIINQVKFKFKTQYMILPVTKDKKCVFLDENHKCRIYKSPMRPPLCSQFGCSQEEKLLKCPHINEDKEETCTKDRLISKMQNLAQKIARNKSKGYSTEKLEEDFEKAKAKAKEKGIEAKNA